MRHVETSVEQPIVTIHLWDYYTGNPDDRLEIQALTHQGSFRKISQVGLYKFILPDGDYLPVFKIVVSGQLSHEKDAA